MKHYFFLSPFLPPLKLGEKPPQSFQEIRETVKQNLTGDDYQQVETLLRFVDISNIRALLIEEPIDKRGNLTDKELDEALLMKSRLPDYVFDFLDPFESPAEKVRNFHGVLSLFFAHEIAKSSHFLKRYLQFERDFRLVLTALRAKRLKRDLAKELQFEDLTDPFVLQILAQKDADQYDPPSEYLGLRELIASCEGDPWKERRAFDRYRFEAIEEMIEGEPFSLGRILAYLAQLSIIEAQLELDQGQGKMILDTFKTN